MHIFPPKFLAFPILLCLGCGQPNVYQPPPPPTVKVASPLIQTVTNYLDETATTEAVAKVEIRARVEGFLESIHFQPGSEVHAGKLLYEIEPELYRARVDSAQAQLQADKARLMNAESEKNRQERIKAQNTGATSEAAVIDARAKFEAAQATVLQSEAQLKQAQIDYQYTKITAPINGRVGKTLVKQGNLVGSGGQATLLTTIITYDPIYANFNISERQFLALLERSQRENDGTKAEVLLRRATDEGFPFTGHFDYADLAVDQSTGTFMIRAIFPNPTKKIVPGLFVTVRLPLDKLEDATLIPERAVGEDQAGKYVFVVDAQNEVSRRSVTTGMKSGELMVILEGLTAADTIITDGLQRARPGAKVNPERIDLTHKNTTTEVDGSKPSAAKAPPS